MVIFHSYQALIFIRLPFELAQVESIWKSETRGSPASPSARWFDAARAQLCVGMAAAHQTHHPCSSYHLVMTNIAMENHHFY